MSDLLRAGHTGRRRQPGQRLDVDGWEDDDSPTLLPIRRKRMPSDGDERRRRRAIGRGHRLSTLFD
jgi:hypothetical protein